MRQRSWRERSVGFGFDKRSSATFASELHALRRAAASTLPWRAGCSSSSNSIARRLSAGWLQTAPFITEQQSRPARLLVVQSGRVRSLQRRSLVRGTRSHPWAPQEGACPDSARGAAGADGPECAGPPLHGHHDPAELAVWALLGQQVSVAAARTPPWPPGGRRRRAAGATRGRITHRYPAPAALDPDAPAAARGSALTRIAAAFAAGRPFVEHAARRRVVDGRLRPALRSPTRTRSFRPTSAPSWAPRPPRRRRAGGRHRQGLAPVPRLRGRPPLVGGHVSVELCDAADLGLDPVEREADALLAQHPAQRAMVQRDHGEATADVVVELVRQRGVDVGGV